jgi:hypothetical protein
MLPERGLDDHIGRRPEANVEHYIEPSRLKEAGVRREVTLSVLPQHVEGMLLLLLLEHYS